MRLKAHHSSVSMGTSSDSGSVNVCQDMGDATEGVAFQAGTAWTVYGADTDASATGMGLTSAAFQDGRRRKGRGFAS